MGLLFTVAVFLPGLLVQAKPPEFDHGVDLPTKRPLNIAHRGSHGRLPENTAEAFERAIQDGADVLECDALKTYI